MAFNEPQRHLKTHETHATLQNLIVALKLSVCCYRDDPPGLNEDHHVGLYSVEKKQGQKSTQGSN